MGKSATATLTVSVALPIVNHAPTFTKGPDVSLAEESSPIVHAVPARATAFSPGPANESSQTLLGYHLTNDHPLLFSTQPAIDTSGNLTYTLAANRNGVANVSVTVQDNGGTLNGGVEYERHPDVYDYGHRGGPPARRDQ